MVHRNALAKIMGLSETRVSQLGLEGVIKQAERGRYYLMASIAGYIAYIKNARVNGKGKLNGEDGEENITSRKEKKLELECEKIRVFIEKEKRNLIPIEEMIEGASMAGVTISQAFDQLEDDLPPMLEGLTALAMKSKLRDYGRMKRLDMIEHFEIEGNLRDKANQYDEDEKQMAGDILPESKTT